MSNGSTYDFNSAEPQRGELIPDGTIALVVMTIRPGNAGEGGWLKLSKARDKLMIDAEFTVADGPHARRKFWGLMIVEGSEKAAAITRSTLRGILESARGIRPDDMSDAARQRRVVAGYGDFDGIVFCAKIGVEKGTEGYSDKNRLVAAITPDQRGYIAPDGTAAPAPRTAAPAAAGGPAWSAPKSNGAGAQRPAWAS